MKRIGISRRGFLGALALGAALSTSLVGCGPPWIVVRQANPSPMLGKNEFVVEPITYPGLMIGDKPEAVYLGEKQAESRQSFENDKNETAKNLIEQLMATAGAKGLKVAMSTGAPGPFNLRPAITFVEPGSFNGFVNIPTVVRMSLQILDGQGQVIDEVLFKSEQPASIYNPSSGGRMHSAGKDLGVQVANYLTTRVTPGK